MNILFFIASFIISLPARLAGMRLGKDAVVGPGYNFLGVNMRRVSLGDNSIIGRGAFFFIQNNKNIKGIHIGARTNVGKNATFACVRKIKIGNDCLIGYNVSFLDHDHRIDDWSLPPTKGGLTEGEEIIVSDECFVGAHSFILKGVRLGKKSVVGAGSVVTKSFPSYSVVAGNPAKLVKKLKS